jgi:hypothetical protein
VVGAASGVGRLTDPGVLDYFATKNAEKWAAKAAGTSIPWMHDLAAWTSQWAIHRTGAANGDSPPGSTP